MNIESSKAHDLKNQLAISIGMIELIQKMILRDGKELDLNKLSDRLERSIIAQKKLQEFFETASKENN